jgi:hypothetical protein
MKRNNKSSRRSSKGLFRTGPNDACEATLFECSSDSEAKCSQPESPQSRHLLAATSVLEAVQYMAEREPDFHIRTVRSLGVIVLLSGSRYQ